VLLTLRDGREFDYLVNGADSDQAVLFHHGTPGDCSAWSSWLPEISTALAVAASRPGYGLSARREGRSVASDIDDQSELIDYLGVKKFVSIGWSGGGPHAINMTRHPRSVGAITLAGVGEWGHEDLDFLAGMGPENYEEFGAALEGVNSIEEWMRRNSPGFARVTGEELISALGGLIGRADTKALTPEVADRVATAFRRALSRGYYGWLDDDLAFVQRFGFALEAITKPVLLWQGDDDFMVPRAHSQWLAKHLPSAELFFVPGHGHISLVEKYRGEIVTEALRLLGD
jgi:pimeloyl-ACP methyl ester carboxylesterase